MRLAGIVLLCLALCSGEHKNGAPRPFRMTRIESSDVWSRTGDQAFYFESKLAIDADGAPNAYHPNDTGIDALSNAGHAGKWWALATDNGRPDGTPIVQGPSDPYPGYYVSMTSLEDTTRSAADPGRYVDASRVPYIVLPGRLSTLIGAKLGDYAFVVNTRNGRTCAAIFADLGPENRLGEGSIALARILGIRDDARVGGADGGVVTIVFPGSGSGKPVPTEVFSRDAERRFKKWGGLKRLAMEFPGARAPAPPNQRS